MTKEVRNEVPEKPKGILRKGSNDVYRDPLKYTLASNINDEYAKAMHKEIQETKLISDKFEVDMYKWLNNPDLLLNKASAEEARQDNIAKIATEMSKARSAERRKEPVLSLREEQHRFIDEFAMKTAAMQWMEEARLNQEDQQDNIAGITDVIAMMKPVAIRWIEAERRKREARHDH